MLRVNPVVVVGAGPAGSVAALVLARSGLPVVLCDRVAFPRPKLCGDTVNPGTLAMLDRLGVGASVRSRSLPITGMLVTGPHRAAVAADYPGGLAGAAIERSDLDALLVNAAIAAGATFVPGARADAPVIESRTGRVVGIQGDLGGEREMRATLVIGADGRGSKIGGALGLTGFAAKPQRWAFGAYYEGVEQLTSRGEMHVRPDGYLGVAPIGNGRANVCVVRQLDASTPPGRDGAAATIAAAIDADATLRLRFIHATRVSTPVVLGPLAVEALSAGCPGLLLAGDAAGFVDPMTGDGLRFAVRGGMLAAEAALKELETGQPAHQSLERARRREFSGKWRLNRTLRWIVGQPGALETAARVGAMWPATVRGLIAAAGDVDLARI
jgi:menaquinone-9 beta-reductase